MSGTEFDKDAGVSRQPPSGRPATWGEPSPELVPETPIEPPAPAPEAPPGPRTPSKVKRPKKPKAARGGFGRFVRRLAVLALAIALAAPPLSALVYKVVPPPVTFLMLERLVQGYGLDYRWRPLSQISEALPEAAVASEDARFCSHRGFDFEAMRAAMRADQRHPGGKLRGGSTISQQTAKNVFLWPGRSYVRKAVEAWWTVLIEAIWGKPRIMEVYLNVVEFGPGVYGAEAASQRFFHEDASQLTPAQAARLVSVLPRPLVWAVVKPGPYVARRSRRIGGEIGTVREDDLAACVWR